MPKAGATKAEVSKANVPKGEPALIVSGVGAAVSYVGSALVAHGVIGSAEMSSAEQTIVPAVSAALVVLLGLITRRLVRPAQWLERELAQVRSSTGHTVPGLAPSLSDQDWSRITDILRAELATAATGAATRTTPTPAAKPNAGRTTP